jgi:murein DD-endopeptidase MepM/ murein hydrolase activator NlpD
MILKRTGLAVIMVLLGFLSRASAQQGQIVINPQFDYIRQGSVGIVTLTGPDMAGAVLAAFGRTYPFFPYSKGLVCLLSVALNQKIQGYPIQVTVTRKGGTTAAWQGTVKVASGEFVAEKPFALPANKLNLIRDDVQQSEDSLLLSIYKVVTPIRYWEGAFTPPINAPFTSPFGSFRHYNGNMNKVYRHTGSDLRAAVGVPVLASANGRVVLSRPLDIHGDSVIIDHGWGIFTEYSHLSARYVVPGQLVLQGEVIGLSGDTGRSLGPHVHWEVAVNGNWVNPLTFKDMKIPN